MQRSVFQDDGPLCYDVDGWVLCPALFALELLLLGRVLVSQCLLLCGGIVGGGLDREEG